MHHRAIQIARWSTTAIVVALLASTLFGLAPRQTERSVAYLCADDGATAPGCVAEASPVAASEPSANAEQDKLRQIERDMAETKRDLQAIRAAITAQHTGHR